MIHLYHLTGCPYCHMVRDRLDDLGLEYESVEVPGPHFERTEVFRVSGQYTVPVLVDGDVVLADENEIMAYLNKTYGEDRKRDGGSDGRVEAGA